MWHGGGDGGGVWGGGGDGVDVTLWCVKASAAGLWSLPSCARCHPRALSVSALITRLFISADGCVVVRSSSSSCSSGISSSSRKYYYSSSCTHFSIK